MSYQFDTTRLQQSATAVTTAKTERPVRLLARRSARALRREIRSI